MKKLKHKKKTKTPDISIYSKIFLLCCSIFFCFLFIELVLRIFFPVMLYQIDIYDANKHYFHHPINKTIIYKSPQLFVHEYRLEYKTNDKGFCDIEHNYSNIKKKIRIVALGDSFTEGGATFQNQTFVYLLNKRLNLQNNNYETINLGLGGRSPDNYFFTYKNEGRLYKPKYVIEGLFVGNDIVSDFELLTIKEGKILEKEPAKEQSAFVKFRQFLGSKFHSYILLVTLLQNNKFTHTTLYKLGIFDAQNNIDIYTTSSRHEFLTGMNATLLVLNETNKIVKENNSTFIILLIPVKEQIDDKRYFDYYSTRKMIEINGQFEAQDIIKNFCISERIVCIDLLQELREKNINNTFFWNVDGHFNHEGHKITAEILYKKITELELEDNKWKN